MKQKYLIKENASIQVTIKKMKKNGIKSLFIVDDKSVLIGSVSDGDIRGALLKKKKMKDSIRSIINYSPKFVSDDKTNLIPKKLKGLFQKFKIEEIPIVNKNKNIIKVISWTDFYKNKLKPKKIVNLSKYDLKVVIMAGGKGSRLKPFTDILPKPLIPVKKKTIIEHIINSFTKFNIKKLIITTNYKSEILKSYLIDKFINNSFKFIKEKKPLGTAGSLKLIKSNSTFLVSNCDVYHKIKLNKFVDFHFKDKNQISLVVAKKKNVIPYGVCKINKKNQLINLVEKPSNNILISTGLYIVQKKVVDLIPKKKFYDFNDLVSLALKKNLKVGVFKINDSEWHDVGKWDEYSKTMVKF